MSSAFPWKSVSTVLLTEIMSYALKNKKQKAVLLHKICHENMCCISRGTDIVYNQLPYNTMKIKTWERGDIYYIVNPL
jgi:hypothetical protein